MNEAREVIARAVHSCDTEHGYANEPENYSADAEAILSALEEAGFAVVPKEASKEMVETGHANIAPWFSVGMQQSEDFGNTRKAAQSAWRGMIDVALKDSTPNR